MKLQPDTSHVPINYILQTPSFVNSDSNHRFHCEKSIWLPIVEPTNTVISAMEATVTIQKSSSRT